MALKEEFIEKIRTSLDIVEVIGEYVQLKKQGRNYTALCPFHNEHTPSFSVSPDKQIFKCFGCGVGGNIYNFVMELEGISFPEAVQQLSDRAGVELPRSYKERQSGKKTKDNGVLYDGLDLLTKYYAYILQNTEFGHPGAEYLSERHFDKKTQEVFQLGYAPNDWHTATKFLTKRDIPLKPLETTGMLSKREFDGKHFDRFRHRLMFPIWDHRGKTVAFAGRVLDGSKPKYLNTPESSIFHKGNILYAFHLARPHIKRTGKVVLFEGYADVIKAHQAGIEYGVASMGTSLTDNQASMLCRTAETVIICYDSDQAGIEAAFRASEVLQPFGRTIKIAKMPDELDPDDYIDQYGGKRFETDVLGASQTVMAFKMDFYKKRRNLNDEGERLRYIEEVIREIAQLTKAVERDHYLRRLAQEFSLSLDALKQQQYQMFRKMKREGRQNDTSKKIINVASANRLLPAHYRAERQLLAHMLIDQDIAEQVHVKIAGGFSDDIHQAIAAMLYAFYTDGQTPDIGKFIEWLEQQTELQKAVTDIAMMPLNEELSQQELDDYIQQVIKHNKLLEIEQKEQEKKEAEKNSDLNRAAEILSEMIAMKKELSRH